MSVKPNPFGPPSETAQISKPPPMNPTPMEGIEQPQPILQLAPAPKKAESTGSSAAPTPSIHQKTKPKEAAPPPLPGGGLLSGMPFGGAAPSKTSSTEGTNIWLTFPLKGQTNVTINFAREVEKKYGFAALHPRVAAARERRRQMAAATAALERGSGAASADDMSVDLSEPESNVEMGGMDDELTQEGKKRQRKKKVEDYDKDDDFIDDTELAWEQSALMAKDGFFVYSGPLITEGEKPAVERADGTVARARGRGRGRGGATRGDAAANKARGGGGRGSRGGMTTRKPRVTKADRAMMEAEKLEREKMAQTLAAKPTPMAPFPGTVS
ncbi:HIR complex subunit [Neofusicoccum ribis]|uniref:HIR complex subunit n=1 Tax=Neofusicoccum ribis TaxID=45134 RepID=A0ABR3SCI9_9PEZI